MSTYILRPRRSRFHRCPDAVLSETRKCNENTQKNNNPEIRPSRRSANRRGGHMICRDDIISDVEKELDDLLADAPNNLSAKALKAIKEESINDTKRVPGRPD